MKSLTRMMPSPASAISYSALALSQVSRPLGWTCSSASPCRSGQLGSRARPRSRMMVTLAENAPMGWSFAEGAAFFAPAVA